MPNSSTEFRTVRSTVSVPFTLSRRGGSVTVAPLVGRSGHVSPSARATEGSVRIDRTARKTTGLGMGGIYGAGSGAASGFPAPRDWSRRKAGMSRKRGTRARNSLTVARLRRKHLALRAAPTIRSTRGRHEAFVTARERDRAVPDLDRLDLRRIVDAAAPSAH